MKESINAFPLFFFYAEYLDQGGPSDSEFPSSRRSNYWRIDASVHEEISVDSAT